MTKKEITCDIKKEYYQDKDSETKVPIFVGVVSWNKGEEKLNIRRVYKNPNGDRLGKGVSLNDEEALAVCKALIKYLQEEGINDSCFNIQFDL